LDGRAQSCRASLPAPRLELSFQKRVGQRQLPDLGVQVPDLTFIDQRCLAATTFKDTGRAIQQRMFALIDHRRLSVFA
jgi:hypothetical protein